MMLRTLLATAVAGLGLLTAGSAAAQAPLTTELFVSGLQNPTDLTFAPGDPSRIFVIEQAGRVRVVENGTLLATPFLNINPEVASGGERGLLGLAFHPDYANNGRFFVSYTNNSGNSRVAEYTVSSNPNVANPTRVQFISQVNQDFSNHNGGCIKFGPDGKLYFGLGDGGSGNDPNGRAQNGQSLLGKMLRYDVDIAAPFIPSDNPFLSNGSIRNEIYHLGLRNPWRFTFDRATGDMWIADVGQNQREEVDFIPAGQAGLNLGWRCKEGTRCTGLSGCSCTNTTLLDPIQEYNHGQGCSITGGMIYRGNAIPSLQGTYFYADYCSNRIWSIEYDGSSVQNFTDRTIELRPTSGSISSISSFGEDHDGEVYIVTQSGGRIWKIIEEPPACGFTSYCSSNPGSSGAAAQIAATGSASIATNNFVIAASGLPPFTVGLFFYGPEQTQISSGLGNLCVVGNSQMPAVRLYPAVQAGILGSVARAVDFNDPNQSTGPGAILPGMTLNFQCYFRDNVSGVPTFNFSNAMSVLFCP